MSPAIKLALLTVKLKSNFRDKQLSSVRSHCDLQRFFGSDYWDQQNEMCAYPRA